MKKLLIAISLFLLSAPTFAQSYICPATLTCNNDTGLCNTPSGWILVTGAASEPFSGSKTMNISYIRAYKPGTSPNYSYYLMNCVYNYGNHSSVGLVTPNVAKNLTGNWIYSGFGNKDAKCATPSDLNSCVGESL